MIATDTTDADKPARITTTTYLNDHVFISIHVRESTGPKLGKVPNDPPSGRIPTARAALGATTPPRVTPSRQTIAVDRRCDVSGGPDQRASADALAHLDALMGKGIQNRAARDRLDTDLDPAKGAVVS